MLLRQLFDYETYTYTYLIADETNKYAALIDPVIDQMQTYTRLLEELSLNLKCALDTHVHADHITALGALREQTKCNTYLGLEGEVNCADSYLFDGQIIKLGSIDINVIYTPGHTDNSFCFHVKNGVNNYLFTGDTLLLRGSGRTDFQNGNSHDLYNSLHNKLMKFSDDTIVLPGHDYKGWTQSTIAEEKLYNPRLQIHPIDKFAEFMSNLKLANPKFMDVAVPANLSCGKTKE